MSSKPRMTTFDEELIGGHTREAAIFVYEMVLHINENFKPNKDDIIFILKENCKKWCFQLEKGEQTGAIHYQGRISFKERLRKKQALKKLECWPTVYLSPTSNHNKTNDFYVMKSTTRIEGPWANTDKEDRKMTRELLETICVSRLPWQDKIIEMVEKFEVRKIIYIYGPIGMEGKTFLLKYLWGKDKAEWLPYCINYEKIMQNAYAKGAAKVFIMDMPRAVRKDKQEEIYGAIETLKGGMSYDSRYSYKELFFDPPQIVVYSNSVPDWGLLSRDRWNCWTLQGTDMVPGIRTPYFTEAPVQVNPTYDDACIVPCAPKVPIKINIKWAEKEEKGDIPDGDVPDAPLVGVEPNPGPEEFSFNIEDIDRIRERVLTESLETNDSLSLDEYSELHRLRAEHRRPIVLSTPPYSPIGSAAAEIREEINTNRLSLSENERHILISSEIDALGCEHAMLREEMMHNIATLRGIIQTQGNAIEIMQNLVLELARRLAIQQ